MNTQDQIDEGEAHRDFYELFTTNPNKDMLKYAYRNPALYDAVTQSSDYYLFREEATLIAQNKDILTKHLQGIKTIVELGPGSEAGLAAKTIPLLSYAENANSYIAVDISQTYLEKIGQYVKSHTDLAIELIKADFTKDQIKIPQDYSPKAVMLLGSTIGNFNDTVMMNFFQNLSHFTDHKDVFMLAIDTNHTSEHTIKAYNGEANRRFILDILEYYSQINPSFKNFVKYFEVNIEWDEVTQRLITSLVSNKTVAFLVPGHGNVLIPPL